MAYGEKDDSGLSKFGVKLINSYNQSDIVIDLSYAGPRTALEAIIESEQPVVSSHSNARELCDAPRNVSDEIFLLELAKRGGVIGASTYNW